MPIYLVRAFDFGGLLVFERITYVKKGEDLIDKTIYEVNQSRKYEKRLFKTKLHYSTKLLVEKVPGMEDDS
jgi:hypothetical protein